MEISNNDIARILGNIEANLKTQMQSSLRQEVALASLDQKINLRLDTHDERLRALEQGAARAGIIAGIGSSIGIAVIVEIAKRKLGM